MLASNLVARYLVANHNSKGGSVVPARIPLLGMACVVIASKYFEANVISVQELIKRTGNKVTYQEFM